MQTKEGLKLAISCLKYGSAKERKKIIKSLKGHIMKLALNDFGCLFLISIISIVDDTKLISKIVIQELAKKFEATHLAQKWETAIATTTSPSLLTLSVSS